MTPPVKGWKAAKATISVPIPTLEGVRVAETIEVEVSAWRDEDGEIYLSGEAESEIEAIKARHMGLMTPQQLKELRQALELTQKEIAHLLQLGEKTWTRWESGRERPSRSMNILLNALMDGHVNVTYLRCRHPDFIRQQSAFHPFRQPTLPRRFPTWNLQPSINVVHESESVAS